MNSVSHETATDVRSCADCGFVWSALTRSQLAARMTTAVESFVDVILGAGDRVGTRPSEGRWSILEYAGHLRDVLLSIRERVILAAILDVPVGTPIYRDDRVDIGFYAQDTASDVSTELQVATYLFLKTVATLPDHFEDRGLIYSSQTPLEITIAGAMLNALHECEHHLGDVREDLRMLDGAPPR